MIKEGLVSTVIPVYNRPELIVESVKSVLDQTHKTIEIIIVDDGSTDSTKKVVDELAEKWPKIISVIHNDERGGPGIAREAGRKHVNGEFVQYLDSDDVLLPHKFEWQVSGLRNDPECDISYGKTRYRKLGETYAQNIPLKRTGEKIEAMFPAFLLGCWWSTLTPLFRRSIIDKAGAWTALINEEDWEYDCRLASYGVKLHYVDDFICEVRDHLGYRLCRDGASDPEKLANRAKAHALILQHAKNAEIPIDSPEMRHYSKELFLLARQCGSKLLVAESKKLFALSREAAGEFRSKGIKYRAYKILCMVFGWGTVGKLVCLFDKISSQ